MNVIVDIITVLSYTCPAGFDCVSQTNNLINNIRIYRLKVNFDEIFKVSQQICNNEALECAPGLYCPGGSRVSAGICKRGGIYLKFHIEYMFYCIYS